MRCSACSKSCGDDFKTRTKYAGPEDNAGDALKVILSQCYDLSSEFNLQISEMKALLNNLIDEHFCEVDLMDDPKVAKAYNKKKKALSRKKKS